MPKQLEAFRKDFADVQKLVSTCLDEIHRDTQLMGQCDSLLLHGAEEVGLRVQKLKSEGMHGVHIDDFKDDQEIKKMLESLNDCVHRAEQQIAHATELKHLNFRTAEEKFVKLKQEVATEIGERRKQVSTKVGSGNKSLPDMEKLLAELDRYQERSLNHLRVFTPSAPASQGKALAKHLDRELAKTKEVALSEFQRTMDQQMLNLRILKQNQGKAVALVRQVMELVEEARRAAAGGNRSGLTAAMQKIAAAKQELDHMVNEYERAANDVWIGNRIDQSKDKNAILNIIAAMKRGREEVQHAYAAAGTLKVS